MTLPKALPNGVWPVMLTPFSQDRLVDWHALDCLTDYYLEEGVPGIFVVTASGEFLELSDEERLRITRRVFERVSGRARLVATGNFGPNLDRQMEFIERMRDTGVDAVVLAPSFLPGGLPVVDRLLEIAQGSNAPLGVYESPVPTHILLDPPCVGTLAHTGRFLFYKDTCCRLESFREKVRLSADTPLNMYDANLDNLLGSATDVGGGFSGCMANLAPWLIGRYFATIHDMGPWHQQVAPLLQVMERVMFDNIYPASAKYALNRLGVPIEPWCRLHTASAFGASQAKRVDEFLDAIAPCLTRNHSGSIAIRPGPDFVLPRSIIGGRLGGDQP